MRVLMFIMIAIALVAVASLPGTIAHQELDVRVTHGVDNTNETTIYQGDSVEFLIWIFNNDTSADDQIYWVHVEDGGEIIGTPVTPSIPVGYFTEKNVSLILFTTKELSLGEHVIPFVVVSDNDTDVRESARITLSIIKRIETGIAVHLEKRRIVLEPGQTGSVHVNITNEYNIDREIQVTAYSSSNTTYATIDREHTIRAGRTLELIMYVYAGETSDAFISIHVVTTATSEVPTWRHVNVTVVEDLRAMEERESSSSSGPAANTIIGFTIGYLIAMFLTVIILKDRLPRH